MGYKRKGSKAKRRERRELLQNVARTYVLRGLGGKNFNAIPYANDVVLRAPFCPRGSDFPLIGKENLRTLWWPPLPKLVSAVQVLDTYVNDDLTSVTIVFHAAMSQPVCTLRVADRFEVDSEGYITAQENFFDPRNVTNPGWNNLAT